MALINGRGNGNLGFGIPGFIKDGLNPLHHLNVAKNLVTKPKATIMAETGTALSFIKSPIASWKGAGAASITPEQVLMSQAAAANPGASLPACGFFARLSRFFGGNPACQ